MKKTLSLTLVALLLLQVPALCAVEVSSFVTGGAGTQSDPWTGWDTAIAWSADTEYHFDKKGWYAYQTSPNFLKPGIALVGEAGVNIKHLGGGDAFVMDAGATPGTNWVQGVRVENLTIWGNAQSRHGLYLRGVRNGLFSHLSVKDVPEACLWTEAAVTNVLLNFRCTNHEPVLGYGWAVRPKYGIVTSGRGGDWSTTWTIINPVIENTGLIGIWFKQDSYGNTVVNGTSEGNLGKGVVIEGSVNSFLNTDLEANGGAIDAEIRGQNNSLVNITSDGLVHFMAGQRHKAQGGRYHNLTIDFTVDQVEVSGATLTGALSDNALSTVRFGNYDSSGWLRASKLGVVLPLAQYPTIQNGALVTNLQTGNFFSVFVGQNFTLGSPAGAVDGQEVTWKFTSTSTYALTYGGQFRCLKGTCPTGPPSSGPAWWYLIARYNAAQQTWDIINFTN